MKKKQKDTLYLIATELHEKLSDMYELKRVPMTPEEARSQYKDWKPGQKAWKMVRDYPQHLNKLIAAHKLGGDESVRRYVRECHAKAAAQKKESPKTLKTV